MTLQDLIATLSGYWASRGCLIQQPHDLEIGAGTMHPETFLRVLGPSPWRVAYVQPSRRPTDGRFGENPNRLFKHHQFQVVLKPSPDQSQQLFLMVMQVFHPLNLYVRIVCPPRPLPMPETPYDLYYSQVVERLS